MSMSCKLALVYRSRTGVVLSAGQDPLHFAVLNNSMDMVKLLKSQGASAVDTVRPLQ